MSVTASSMDDVAAGATAEAKPRKRTQKILKGVGYAALALAAVLFVAHLLWRASGSNEWELAREENGVKVWTMKSPGSTVLRVKSEVRINSNLGGMVKLLEDLDSCADSYCYDTLELRRIPSLPGHYGKYVRFKFDIPIPGFKTREYVLFAEHVQDPNTKQIEINIMASPDMMPRDECCIRVTHLHNNWKLTPLPNNQLDIEFTQDTDLGGMQYVLANIALKEGMFKVLNDMQDFMNKDRYKNAKVDYIEEL